MPNYPWLLTNMVNASEMETRMSAMRTLGVPYTDTDIAEGPASVEGKSEMDAMIAYLQVLGTMINFQEGREYRE